jgi:glycosyltransferase involved in cell wall biosynthesis
VATLGKRFRHLLDSRRWIFAGQLEGKDRLAAFGASDIFALTSYSENFGLAVVEAMAAGLPVVLSRECPWPQVEQWQSGFWVQNDPVNVAEALLTLSADEELRHRMGENGRRGVFESLGWPRIAEKMRSAYEECLRVSAGRAGSQRSDRSRGGQLNEQKFRS